MDTVREGLFNQTATPRADLAGVTGVNQHHPTCSIFSFLRRVNYQLPPRSIGNALGEAVILDHIPDVQVLKADDITLIYKAMAQVMAEISPPVGDALVDTGHDFVTPDPVGCSLLTFAQPTLDLGKGLFLLAEEAGVVNLLASREDSEGRQAQVDADIPASLGQRFWLNLAGEAGKPLASGIAMNDGLFGFALDRPVEPDFDVADLGKVQLPVIGDAKAKLRICQTAVAALALKAGIAWLFPILAAAKEALEGFVHAALDILDNLRVDNAQRGSFLFPLGKQAMGIVHRHRFLPFLPGIAAIGKRLIVDPLTFLKHLLKERFLSLGRIDSVAEGFYAHTLSMAQFHKSVKSAAVSLC